MRLNKVEDPAAVLAIPTEEDVEIIKQLLDSEAERVEPEYQLAPSAPTSDAERTVLTRGSLIQELKAQLNNQ